jgi:hypothetical protein
MDFSRFIVDVTTRLGQEMKDLDVTYETEMKYKGPTYVPFETISRIEIVMYESRYSIIIDGTNEKIPPPYKISEIFPTVDKTID